MADWATRLAVSYHDESGKTVLVTPVDSVAMNYATNAEVIHSLERSHAGIVFSPQGMSFTINVKAIGDVAAQLTSLALTGERFSVILQEREGESADWGFKTVVMTECVITSAAHTANSAGAPTATFSGMSLASSAEPKTSQKVAIP
jgi:hypothetical protein